MLLALLSSSILLFGCLATVPQSQYDQLRQECDQKQQADAAALATAQAQANSYKRLSDDCAAQKMASDRVIADQGRQIQSMQADVAKLESAREKADLVVKYETSLVYYNDTYGPGQIPTNAKLKRMETLLLSMGDSGLYAIWLDATRCTAYFECQSARERFFARANESMNSLAFQIADIVETRE